jgi:hypothetical protein
MYFYTMKKFIIERTIPGAGTFTTAELAEIAKKSNAVAFELGIPYHWVHTYVTEDKLFCVHIAPDMETIQKHSDMGCFPVDKIYEVKEIFDSSYEK